ncbi:DUF4352 domain-containing protein [Haloplanus rubicundus]|uniref:DUF4352 domain-containing protein n=1 Tax=Haloplanus rubicundus TaxID=1547898 RepID=A0A345DZ55_9EURY|nr:DUF4352 domain-containing protein [Haloplanus rubicundus]AXG05227.1 DUF4352 domain-containing protein [Haloplanus rubicundus]AXG08553.1 DUF4352 domain-containing protein [Haloplanus rubicundus]
MERRNVLTACGTVLTGLLAGCGGGGGGDATPTGTATAEATATETEAPTATATEAPEPTATDTPEPTATEAASGPGGPTHEVGESFTVGSGNEAVGYRIVDFFRADQIGSSANNSTADGTYLIVVLDLSNPRDGSLSFPNNSFLAWNEEQILYIDDEATPQIGDDDRIDVEPIGTATVLSGNTKTGAVVFDVDPDRNYWIRINPTGGSGESHYVPVGPVSEVQELRSSMT